MKLNIGRNIRTLRRAADMTQEELADKLGVTYQSVSRWENGGTYPDMELLPAIADIFGVTVDHLLDRDRVDVRKELQSLVGKLECAVTEHDTDRVTDILRTIRRDLRLYAEEQNYGEFQEISLILERYADEAPAAVLGEFRQFLDGLEMHIPKAKGIAVRTMAVIEDDEHLDAFLDKYSSHMDLSIDNLLLRRYRGRKETENYAYMNQMQIHAGLCKIFRYAGSWSREYRADEAWMSGPCLRFLHELQGLPPDTAYPVSGDGTVDLWVEERIGLGFQYAAYLITQKCPEPALDVLEDIAELLGKITDFPLQTYAAMPPAVLKSTSPLLKDFTRTAYTCCFSDPENGDCVRRGMNIAHGKKVNWGSQIYPMRYLGYLDSWNEFDPVRASPRFLEVRARLEQLAEPIPQELLKREAEKQRACPKEKGLP